MEIRSTETLAREVIDGQMDEILGYINPANDGMLSAWEMARDRARRMVGTLDTVCKAIAARPLATGNDAMRAIADEPPFSEESFADEIRQTIAARKIPTATPEEDERMDEIEARQIERAHPVVFDLASYAAESLGMAKEA